MQQSYLTLNKFYRTSEYGKLNLSFWARWSDDDRHAVTYCDTAAPVSLMLLRKLFYHRDNKLSTLFKITNRPLQENYFHNATAIIVYVFDHNFKTESKSGNDLTKDMVGFNGCYVYPT